MYNNYFDNLCLKLFNKETYINIYNNITYLIYNISSGYSMNNDIENYKKYTTYNDSILIDITLENNNSKNNILNKQEYITNDWELI